MAKAVHELASSGSCRRSTVTSGRKSGSPVGFFITIACATALGALRYFAQDHDSPFPSGESCLRETHPQVNFSFVSLQEGGQQQNVYVPHQTDANGVPHAVDNSGPTVASGVDLGARTRSEIYSLKLPAHLKRKLAPYAGRTEQEALHYIRHHPLVLTRSEANALDKVIQNNMLGALRSGFNHDVDRYNKHHPGHRSRHFERMPSKAQTALFDFAWQFGPGGIAPTVWRQYIAQNYPAVRDALDGLHTRYHSRRWREAELIRELESREENCGVAI